MKLCSCLHDAVINYVPRNGKHINNHELEKTIPPRRVKYAKMSDIKNSLCVRNVRIVTPALDIEREQWDSCSVLRKFYDGVYISSG